MDASRFLKIWSRTFKVVNEDTAIDLDNGEEYKYGLNAEGFPFISKYNKKDKMWITLSFSGTKEDSDEAQRKITKSLLGEYLTQLEIGEPSYKEIEDMYQSMQNQMIELVINDKGEVAEFNLNEIYYLLLDDNDNLVASTRLGFYNVGLKQDMHFKLKHFIKINPIHWINLDFIDSYDEDKRELRLTSINVVFPVETAREKFLKKAIGNLNGK
ncbi:hypothetical protein SAMN05444162_3451 [Paenibacillaceae bacterium GAS479]|nr:hypothetical protein SAMN05444162_3451 [Paenibacillaceae bacterium GAS479]